MQRKTPRISSEAYQKRICSECWHGDIGICGALLKQLYGIHQGVVGHMDITIHGCLDGGMAQKLLTVLHQKRTAFAYLLFCVKRV